jgi:hypothetical protein
MSGFDHEEFQDDLSDLANIAGMSQRRQQLAEQQEIKGLLQQQQQEQERIKRLLKCPACKSPLENDATRCPSCRTDLVRIILSGSGLRWVSETPIDHNLRQLVTELDKTLHLSWQRWRSQVSELPERLAEHYPLLDEASSGKIFHTGNTPDLEALYNLFNKKFRSKVGCMMSLGVILVPAFTMVSLGATAMIYKGTPPYVGSFQGKDWFFLEGLQTGVVIWSLFPIGAWLLSRLSLAHRTIALRRVKDGPEWFTRAKATVSSTSGMISSLNEARANVATAYADLHDAQSAGSQHGVGGLDESKVARRCGQLDWSHPFTPLPGWDRYQEWASHVLDLLKQVQQSDPDLLTDEKLSSVGLVKQPKQRRRRSEKEVKQTVQYHIKRGESLKGPFTVDKLQSLIEAKTLKPSDSVSQSPDGPWERLGDVYKTIVKEKGGDQD